jgi:glutaminyl-peptide cyclotransferase
MTRARTEAVAIARTLKLLFAGCALVCASAHAAVARYDYEIVHTYPHDPTAFTEGLFYLNGFLYESTGLEEHSSIRKVRLETGAVLQKLDIPAQYFGEGIVDWRGQIISLTWKSEVGFVYDLGTFKLQHPFHYKGEGWALTRDDSEIIMSDGTPELRFLDPKTLKETHRIQVTLEGKAISNVNELEWVKGEIYANVWQTDWVLRIDPANGQVVGVINLAGLLKRKDIVPGQTDVLNGIAYDAKGDRLFVTGKNWPKLFEIRLRNAGAAPTSPP